MKVSNWTKKLGVGLVAGGTLIAASQNTVEAATILDFVTGLGNNDGIPEAYGDNLAGTPNIALGWHTADETVADGWDSYGGWDGRGDVGQMDTAKPGANPLTVTLTPDATFGVFLTSFDLDEYAGGGDMVVNWSLVGTSFSGTWDDYSDANGGNGGRSTVNTGMTSGDAVFGPLTLELSHVSGKASYLAMDNLAFDQVAVPEPASLALLGLGGLGALAMRRKRK